MEIQNKSPSAIAEELGERLKQARLNNDLTQSEVAKLTGLSRKAVLNAEKGKAQLEVFIGILATLNLTAQLDCFLQKQAISPVQLAKLQGKQRQRASGKHATKPEEPSQW